MKYLWIVSLAVAILVVLIVGWWLNQDPATKTGSINLNREDIKISESEKHSVPLDEITQGCPRVDCIPSIDEPKFESLKETSEWLDDEEIGLAVSFRGEDKFYPFRILVSHEIVNDKFGNQRVLVSYCPLCFTAIVFDPEVEGERVEFGVSGKLRNSNLLMYDRKTRSLWSQIQGEAVVGPRTGDELKAIPSNVTKFGLWKEQFPNGKVLSRETGSLFANYDSIPYGGDLTDIPRFFPVSNIDDRLPENEYILGLVIDDQVKAYQFEAVKVVGSLTDKLANRDLMIEYVPESDSIRIFDVTSGDREELVPFPAFWFSWVATYPETELYAG